jgi:NADPH-dependent 2,4-dienoyl-CoA reductase/sulfur reductase-like enzyme
LITAIGLDHFSASGRRVTGAVLTDGTEIPADLVVVGIGGRRTMDWLRNQDWKSGTGSS